jgi:hypothetical protein
VAVHGLQVPWGKVVIDGVPVVPAGRLPSMLRALPVVLGPERVAVLADAPGFASAPPPSLTRGGSSNPARTDLNPTQVLIGTALATQRGPT